MSEKTDKKKEKNYLKSLTKNRQKKCLKLMQIINT